MTDWSQSVSLFLSQIQKLLELPEKVQALSEAIEDVEEAVRKNSGRSIPIITKELTKQTANGVCDNCIKLTQAVSSETVSYVFGTLRELLIEARDTIKEGHNLSLGISMLNKILEIASAPIEPIKERSVTVEEKTIVTGENLYTDHIIRQMPLKTGGQKSTGGHRHGTNWQAIAEGRGFKTVKELLVNFKKKEVSITQIAEELGLDKSKVTSKWYSEKIHLI